MIRKSTPILILSILLIGACKKDDTDTSGGTPINPIRELEVFIDGSEWQSDDVYLETIYGSLNIIGNNDDNSKMMFVIDDFDGSGTYNIDNISNTFRYWESSDLENEFYTAVSGSVTIAEFSDTDIDMVGNFELNDVSHVNGKDALTFNQGVFNGIDSLKPISGEILNLTINQSPWVAKSVEVVQNNTLGTITALAQSANDDTFFIIRIPLNSSAGNFDLSGADYSVEYQELNGAGYNVLSGDIEITENDIFNSLLSGSIGNLTLTDQTTGTTIPVNGTFTFEY